MEKVHWEPNISSKEVSAIYGNRSFITMFKKTTTGSYPDPDESSAHLPTFFI
jgi:hypothetical protein